MLAATPPLPLSVCAAPHARRYGTRVNGKLLGAEAAELKPGDLVVIGSSSFQLQAVGS